ncbi:TPA: 5-formyltetrahydrofolate cyclo-ligase [Legionella pneumophila]|uniref:5-formyltetrahydrofolate cyclo-ligase n=1 Tax=Legionella pneumophila TaxID=446 RepID=UPI001A3626D1|nr:5-formyltetrahydrofolate cyclo-ligase [Legionella pneumophila]MCH9094408.1 5-formyltetrahydrofolate cyclo-ligase [Legionella pneumophila serogroup 1]HAU0771484.1 5-formyltetrahydrofolate cyclo-ligase [Legionella pneumophila]HAU0871690.1 5-formyltetrahydrofolate cyclo-ligase [Legionella pneumophila]HCD9491753.1 5-formyltetrahydrofolate cyclo-ligase [Legionella pneumophila]HCD9497593.1 5-formyltetrahydrofolate cyclo-ligase [Legionella pneumophila]
MSDQYKVALRNTIKQVRSKLSVSYRTASSNQICTRIRSLEQYRQAKRIALYFAVNGEVDLTFLWKSAPLQGKYCYFPVLNNDSTLSFLPATPNTPFKTNKYDIPEPDVDIELALPIDELDLIIMPLVAFDAHCTRLGMGSGYYDRTLSNKSKAHLLGVAYQFQRVDYIEPRPWDVPLDAVITQKAIYWRNPLA